MPAWLASWDDHLRVLRVFAGRSRGDGLFRLGPLQPLPERLRGFLQGATLAQVDDGCARPRHAKDGRALDADAEVEQRFVGRERRLQRHRVREVALLTHVVFEIK